MTDQSSSDNSSSSSDEAEEHVQQVQQQPAQAAEEAGHEQQPQQQQHHQDDSNSSMSSSSSSDEEEEQQNQPEPALVIEQQQQQQQGEGDEAEEAVEEVVIVREEEEEGRKETSDDDDEDGIFTTKDDGDEEEARTEGVQAGTGRAGDEHEEEEDDEEEEGHGDEAARGMERMDMDVSDDEEEIDPGPIKIDQEMARCKMGMGEEGGPYFVRMPNFLSIDPKPFDPEAYDDELEEDEVQDEDGKSRVKLKLENTIRWRIVRDAEGNERRESNARLVRWSDGSMSLYLGKELFEVDKQRIMDHNHLYIRQGAALQAQSVFADKLVFRPHSTDTLTHRKVTMNMAEKTSKTQKVRMIANVGDNPDAQKKELIRMEDEKLRAIARREAQQRRVRERPRAMGLTTGFLEGYESDEGAESLAAIKRRYQHAPYGLGSSGDREQYYSESDEEGEQEERQRKAIGEAKIDSEEEEDEEMDTSDTEQRQKQQSKEKRKIVIEEDDEEEE